jgi:hypothetical protein
MKLEDAAKELGVHESKLRRLSRDAGFKRWPARKIQSIASLKKVCKCPEDLSRHLEVWVLRLS